MIDKATRREYERQRKLGNRAHIALYNAKANVEFERNPNVRLRIVPDDCPDMSWLDQDCIDERYRKETFDRANQDGVWGIIDEYFDGTDWRQADSCFGFIGDEWKDSGYDSDIMRATLDALDGTIEATCA